jgi:signal transduction histidine kinase
MVALASLTFFCFRLHLNISTAGFLYLIVVVLLSLAGDYISSTVTAVVAVLCLVYFFVPPIFSVRVAETVDLVSIIAFLTTSLVISRLVSEVRRRSEEALSSVNRKLVDAEERERNRIARELHDDIVQRLALLSSDLDEVQQELPDSELRYRIGALHEEMAKISTDVQEISHELHSSKLEFLGLTEAMRGFCRKVSQQQEVEIKFTGKDLTTALSPEISLCLYRVLQEALHNAMKHSGARQFDIDLFEAPDSIHLTVHDAGVGFDPKAAMHGRGLGLISMQERMKLVNGKLSVSSKLGTGTTIHAWVPISHPQSDNHVQQKVS